MSPSISGEFPDRRSAERAIAALRDAGFDPKRMSLVSQERVPAPPPPAAQTRGTLRGSVIGALAGMAVGALVALAASLLVHGVASITAIGMIVVAIVGAAIGWLVGALAGSGKPLEEGEYRQEQVELGRMRLVVDPEQRRQEAHDILLAAGALDVGEMSPASSSGMSRPETDMDDSQHAYG